jgi:anti-sigma regulatory factor (Ser/Thr protein kinase)
MDSQTITIKSEADVIMARLQVRNLARESGFNIMDQARISLATSSLAHALGLGGMRRGQITLECMGDGTRSTGVRVVCTKTGGATEKYEPGTFSDVRLMVDQITIEELPSNDLQVTLIKQRA